MSHENAPSKNLQLPKKLIVLCDGTWMNSDFGWEKSGIFDAGHPQTPTNVTRLTRAIKRENKTRHPQIVYYQAGVGSSAWSVADHFLGGGLAYGISQNIREAYGFLVHNYIATDPNISADGKTIEDEIFLIGFSRGAFTARSVGGMISGIGLLEKDAMQHFYYIFEDFENAGRSHYQPKFKRAYPEFKLTADARDVKAYLSQYKSELVRLGLSRDVSIQAISVYDTVGTLGMPLHPWIQKLGFPSAIHGYRFFDTGISTSVKHAFQALALDEFRAAFNATVWEKAEDNDQTVLKQVWFAGAHTDIGGGYAESSQSDLTMAWMIDQLSEFIDFNEEYLVKQFEANRKDKFTVAGSPTKEKPLWRWGLGTVHQSLKFPTSLAGSITRTPGAYQKLDYDTGKPFSTPQLLRNTNEYIHSSVRARERNDKGRPPALKQFDFEVHQKHDGSEVATWTNNREKDPAKGVMLQEAPMGELEKRLLGFDKAMVDELRLP